MESSNSETIELDITVNKQDLNNGVWQVISRLKPQWSEDKIEYKVLAIDLSFLKPNYSSLA